MSSYYYLENHDIKEFIKARTKKLLVPSTIGVILFGYPQGYLNMYFANALDNIPAGIFAHSLIRIHIITGFCDPRYIL